MCNQLFCQSKQSLSFVFLKEVLFGKLLPMKTEDQTDNCFVLLGWCLFYKRELMARISEC
jgi:hypothetical protein